MQPLIFTIQKWIIIDFQSTPPVDANTVKIDGTIEKITERLYNEYIKNLQYADPHAQEYVEKLKSEPKSLDLLERSYTYYTKKPNLEACSTLALCLAKQLHFRVRPVFFLISHFL